MSTLSLNKSSCQMPIAYHRNENSISNTYRRAEVDIDSQHKEMSVSCRHEGTIQPDYPHAATLTQIFETHTRLAAALDQPRRDKNIPLCFRLNPPCCINSRLYLRAEDAAHRQRREPLGSDCSSHRNLL